MIRKYLTTGVPFKQNRNLSDEEIEAVTYYRDMGENNPHNWSYPIPPERKKDKDCFMINEFLRGNIPKNKLVDADKKELLKLIPNIHSAITKSFAPCEFEVYKGMSNDSWITTKFDRYGRPLGNDSYIDYGFGSFSSNIDVAVNYSMKKWFDKSNKYRNDKNIYLLVQTLEFGDFALYIDNREYEWLLPPNTWYSFEKKKVTQLDNGFKQVAFYIKRRKR